MKNLTILTLLLISGFAVQAQQNNFEEFHENFFRIGAKAGVNINKMSGKSYGQGFSYNFQGGGFLQFNFSKRFGIQPEVNFVQSQSEFTDDTNSIYDDLFNGGSQHKAKLNYLEVPVLLNINVGPTKRVKFQIGPSYGGLLKQTVDSLKAGTGNIYKNGEWSAIAGFWFQVPLVNFSVRYKLGLSDVNNFDNTERWRNQAIQVGVGVTF